MKIFFILITQLFILNCSQSMISDGENTILGSEARKRLDSAASRIDSYYYGATKRPDLYANYSFYNIYIQPIQLSSNKLYDKASVDDCVSKINSINGFLIGGKAIQLDCKILDAGIVDFGGLKLGNKEAKKNNAALLLLRL